MPFLTFHGLQNKFKKKWGTFTQVQKISAVMISLALIICLFYLGHILIQPSYAPLFAGLDLQEAGAVIENLKALNVDYKVADQGRTIMVPENQVYDLRIRLAIAGDLPGIGFGFELFDKTEFAQTEFEQNVTYQRALQGELQRTIAALDAVERARVHLVLPRDSVFIEQKTPASASVLLELKPGAQLHPEQIRGISSLLIGSVEGLKPENIHIVDTKGNVLSDIVQMPFDPTNVSGAFMNQHELRKKVEKSLENNLKRLLTPICGPGRSAVMVSVELDFSKVQTTIREVLPGQVLSEQIERFRGENIGLGGGVAGTAAQMPGVEYPIAGWGEGEYEKETQIRNYELGEEMTVLEQLPGAIKRIFASVIIDEAAGEIDERAIEQVVASAIGYKPERGDSIVVQTMPFDEEWRRAFEFYEEEPKKEVLAWWYFALAIAGVILLMVLLYVVLKKKLKRKERELRLELERLKQVAASDEDKEYEGSLPEVETTDAEKRIRDLKKTAKEKPGEVAHTLKLWLKE
ncbi:flagellar M-ring protein FliF [Peptococcaceae bacterium]|nr:flagellar M-ring protein FliF [Peptococcaceae bacterium]